eukprot:725702-Amphidinium_carterae.4
MVVKGRLKATTSSNFHTYPRHRWLGCDLATNEFGLLQSIHGLASAAFQKLVSSKAFAKSDKPSCDLAAEFVQAPMQKLWKSMLLPQDSLLLSGLRYQQGGEGMFMTSWLPTH